MPTAIDPREILRVYEALNERVLTKDSKGTLQIYDELLRLGQPLPEIMAHGLRALNDPPVRAPGDAGEAFAGRADATVLDEPPPDRTRPEPSLGSIAGSVGERSDRAIAPDAFGEAPPFAGDAGNQLPLPDPATIAPGAQPQPPRAAMAPLSPIARLGLAACAVAVLAGIGVLLMQPAAQKMVPGGPVSEAPVRVRAETSSTAAAAPQAAGASVSATAVERSSSTEPGPAPTPAAALTVTALPSAEPAPSAQPGPETPQREAVAGAPPAVVAPAPNIPPDQQRLADAEIAALLARGDSLLRVGDIASARLFYERASDAGDGRAALRLGATYDPGFLDRVHLPHLQGDVARALSSYSAAPQEGGAKRPVVAKPEPKAGTIAEDALTHSGFPGRPSKGKHLMDDEFERRVAAGQGLPSLADEAKALLDWYKQQHPKLAQPTTKTIKENIRARHRQWKASRPEGGTN